MFCPGKKELVKGICRKYEYLLLPKELARAQRREIFWDSAPRFSMNITGRVHTRESRIPKSRLWCGLVTTTICQKKAIFRLLGNYGEQMECGTPLFQAPSLTNGTPKLDLFHVIRSRSVFMHAREKSGSVASVRKIFRFGLITVEAMLYSSLFLEITMRPDTGIPLTNILFFAW